MLIFSAQSKLKKATRMGGWTTFSEIFCWRKMWYNLLRKLRYFLLSQKAIFNSLIAARRQYPWAKPKCLRQSRNIIDAEHHIIYTIRCNIVCRRQHHFVSASGMMLTERSNDVASKLANDVVSLRTQIQKERHDKNRVFLFGSPCWTWTNDLRINSPSLYRLS